MIAIAKTATRMALVATVVYLSFATRPACAASARGLELDGKAALQNLYAAQPSARLLASKAKAILVFPSILKAGFMFGGQIGEGVRLEKNKVRGYYSSVAASYGFQAGIQTFGYALFFMDEESLRYLSESRGWELGVGPSLVILDQGMAKNISTTTLEKGVYAFIFNQEGLMAGLGIQGTKITPFTPNQY